MTYPIHQQVVVYSQDVIEEKIVKVAKRNLLHLHRILHSKKSSWFWKSQVTRWLNEHPKIQQRIHRTIESSKMLFGKYKDQTFEQIAFGVEDPNGEHWVKEYRTDDQGKETFLWVRYSQRPNPMYLDNALGWDNLYPETRLRLECWLDEHPSVKEEIDRRAWDYDHFEGGKNSTLTTYKVFTPGNEVSKYFNLGKASYLEVIRNWNRYYKPKDWHWVSHPKNVKKLKRKLLDPTSGDEKQLRWPGPQEPERNWDPKEPSQDLDARPARMITYSTPGPLEHTIRKADGLLAEKEAERALEPKPKLLKKSIDAWRFLASLASQIEEAQTLEDCHLIHDERARQLESWAESPDSPFSIAYQKVRESYATKRDEAHWCNTILPLGGLRWDEAQINNQPKVADRGLWKRYIETLPA